MLVDWLAGTIKGRSIQEGLESVRSALGDIKELQHGGYGYECSGLVCGSGRVYWSHAHPEMGVHVSLPSKAISASGSDAFLIALRLCRAGMVFTRVDLALDDTRGILSFEEIAKSVDDKTYVARSRKWRHIKNNDDGETWYFGSRSSNSIIRIYDKAAEQNVPGHWIRVETEFKGESADQVVRHLIFNCSSDEDFMTYAASLVLGLLDFKKASDDTNKSRWATVEWWEEFLGVVKKLRLAISRGERTVEDIIKWVDKQVAPSLFVLLMTIGRDELLQQIGEAWERLSPEHEAIIDAYRALRLEPA